jgi:glutamate synthase (NADPH/NADH) small chain
MANMNLKKNVMPTQSPHIRNKNFREVALGYTREQAIDEAKRCLSCKSKPCVSACPVSIRIPDFIAKVAAGDFEAAYRIIREASSLPAVCGRVCPQETQCESKCVRGAKGEPVAIGRLERFVADWHLAHAEEKPEVPENNGHKVAVIGSGPSGLACAGELAGKGYQVTVFEALHLAGGVLVYGIPEFRLPKSIVEKEIDGLRDQGVDIETNVVIGKTVSIDELLKEYGFESVFIGSGAGLPKFMHIQGENLKGVYSANEYLARINLMKAYQPGSKTPVQLGRKVVVVGGGNVAMDAARCARRLGAEVSIVYRRTEKELPARREEVEHAREEGIRFLFLTNPTEIIGNREGWVTGIFCEEMRLSAPDASGRAKPVPIYDSEFEIEADLVIMALGTSPNPLIRSTTEGLATKKWGGIITEETTGQTSREGIFAGGDAVTGAATVILAMGAGKNAAAAIDAYLREKNPDLKFSGYTHVNFPAYLLKFRPSK